MSYPEIRALFRQLAQLDGPYRVTDAIQIDADVWSVGVMVRQRYAYRFCDRATFERSYPHLGLVYTAPQLYGPAEAALSWPQVLYLLGWIERAQPRMRVQWLLRNAAGGCEVAVATAMATVERATPGRRARSGVYLPHTLEEADAARGAQGRRPAR